MGPVKALEQGDMIFCHNVCKTNKLTTTTKTRMFKITIDVS